VAFFGVETAVVGDVPSGLPAPSLPVLESAQLKALFPTAIAISLVGFMESISVAKAFAKRSGDDVDADQELVGLGAANLVGSVFGAYPVTGGFSRTAVNAQAGARSGVASLVTASLVALTLLWLTPLFYHLPKAVLAAIIMSAVAGLVDVREARHLWKISRPDLALMAITFVATLTLGIELGILAGVAASLAGFLRRMSRPHIAVLGRLPGTTLYRKVERNPGAETVPGVLAIRFDAPLFFANAGYLEKALASLEAEMDEPVDKVIIDATAISGLDASALEALEKVVAGYEARGVEVWVASMRGPILDVMDRAGLVARIGPDRFVHRVHDAVAA
jgi:SulP family sulfate permease